MEISQNEEKEGYQEPEWIQILKELCEEIEMEEQYDVERKG